MATYIYHLVPVVASFIVKPSINIKLKSKVKLTHALYKGISRDWKACKHNSFFLNQILVFEKEHNLFYYIFFIESESTILTIAITLTAI